MKALDKTKRHCCRDNKVNVNKHLETAGFAPCPQGNAC